ncbi:MAG: hypothetical protein ACT4QG_06935 [Sporichthyaceae bacterium]
MESNSMCNPMLGPSVAMVVDVPTQWQTSARLRSALLAASGMRPTTAAVLSNSVRSYAINGAPKHAPRAFALSGTRSWSPPV